MPYDKPMTAYANSKPGDPGTMLRSMMGGMAPDAFAQALMENNPRFRQFVERNRGKSLSQISSSCGVGYRELQDMMGR